MRFVGAAGWRKTSGQPAALRFVDLESGQIEGTLRLHGERGRVVATAWVRGRVLAVVSGTDGTMVYSIDPDTRTVVGKADAPGNVVAGVRSETASRSSSKPRIASGRSRSHSPTRGRG